MLDHFDSGESVCMECGLVLAGLLGDGGRDPSRGGSGGGVLRYNPPNDGDDGGGDDRASRLFSDPFPRNPDETDLTKTGVELIRDVLDAYGMDNEHVRGRTLHNFRQIFGSRAKRIRFRAADARLAAAFSLCNQMSRVNAPRPPAQIMDLCEVANAQDLLDIPRSLRLTDDELRRLPREAYTWKEASPQDYVDVLGAQLGIPFAVVSRIYLIAEEARWVLHGRQPTVIAAASIAAGLTEMGREELASLHTLSSELSCSVQAARKALQALLRFRKNREEEPEIERERKRKKKREP